MTEPLQRAPAPQATVIDAGVGNLGNLARAVRRVGAECSVTDDPATVAAAGTLLLPGVGAFRPPRERLRGALEEALRAALVDGARLLGICVGYQLLFEGSEEFGETDGLGLIEGTVRRLPDDVPVPHIGWNRIERRRDAALLDGVPDGAFTYFVHSYAPDGVRADQTVAVCHHGREFAAVVGRGNVWGTQFHPEKSGEVGLAILRNFLHGARPC